MFDRILGYIPEIWTHRWSMLGWAWIVCVIGWLAVAFVPDQFTSTAKVYVDTESVLRPLLRGLAVETNTRQQIEVMRRTLITRPNLEEVSRLADLDITAANKVETDLLMAKLRKNISIEADRSNLFTFSYRDNSPEVAQKVVAAVLKIFVESSLGTSRKRLDSAQSFIDEQLKHYGDELNKAESALAEFRAKNAGVFAGGKNFHANMTRLNSEYEVQNSLYRDALNRLKSLRSQLASVPEFIPSDGLSSGPPSALEARVYGLEAKIDSLLLQYTEKHPDVVRARALLAELKQQLEDEQNAFAARIGADSDSETGPQMPNPTYQTIKLQVVQQLAETATLAGKVARQNAKIESLRKQADKVPALEAELNKLTRDYGVIKKNYEQLLSRKETAAISGSRDSKGEKVQFRVVEPPRVPTRSSGIKRSLLAAGVFLAAIGSAALLGVLGMKLDSTFHSSRKLAVVAGYRVLGEVMREAGAGRKLARNGGIALFLAGGISLVSAFGGVMYLERQVGLANVLPEDVRSRVISVMPSKVSGFLDQL